MIQNLVRPPKKKQIKTTDILFESSNPSVKNVDPSFSYPIDRKRPDATASGLFQRSVPVGTRSDAAHREVAAQ